jgi:GNAT superfamily N-acetyltransferase
VGDSNSEIIMTNTSIKIVTWNSVEEFWKEHDSFKSTDPPRGINRVELLECQLSLDDLQTFIYDDSTLGFFRDDSLLGCCRIYVKKFEDIIIGGLGKVAVDPAYRGVGISSALGTVAIMKMFWTGCHVSILWASVLRVYEKLGYVAIYKNMMYRPILGIPYPWRIEDLITNVPKQIGTW